MPNIIEIKARCSQPDQIREILRDHSARAVGTDHQIDTYFKVPNGRLKLREGNIENTLIHYQRPNQAGPKNSKVLLYHPSPNPDLKQVLTAAVGILIVVDKQREIYFIDNVKFHIDQVEQLGSFIEIEAIDEEDRIDPKILLDQCQHYMQLFDIQEADLLEVSYSDLLLQQSQTA
ncbi:MAG: class IV adenylate cyclase [Bacteroidota bacterium]